MWFIACNTCKNLLQRHCPFHSWILLLSEVWSWNLLQRNIEAILLTKPQNFCASSATQPCVQMSQKMSKYQSLRDKTSPKWNLNLNKNKLLFVGWVGWLVGYISYYIRQSAARSLYENDGSVVYTKYIEHYNRAGRYSLSKMSSLYNTPYAYPIVWYNIILFVSIYPSTPSIHAKVFSCLMVPFALLYSIKHTLILINSIWLSDHVSGLL